MNRGFQSDAHKSVASEEFLWGSSEAPESHKYLVPPVLAALRSAGSKTVLDLGCGNGAFTSTLTAEGFDVTGLDFSESGIELARAEHPGAKFGVYEIGSPLPAEHVHAYDAVVSTEVIEHLLLPRQLMTCARDALKPGGMFVVSTPFHGYLKNLALALTGKFDSHWHPLRDYGHVKFFSRSTLTQLFEESGFEDLQFQAVGRVPMLAKSMILCGRTKS